MYIDMCIIKNNDARKKKLLKSSRRQFKNLNLIL